jgi:hypothetical protein
MVMNMVHHMMMHVMLTAFGLHGDRLCAIRSGLRISRGGRLLRRVGGSFSARRRGSGLRGRGLRLLRGVLSRASSK